MSVGEEVEGSLWQPSSSIINDDWIYDNELILNAITSFIPQRDPLLEYPVCALVT